MSWNDLSLSATGKVSANDGLTGPAATGLRDAGSTSSFEQELRRQTEAGDSPETAKAQVKAPDTPAATAAAKPKAGNGAEPAAEDTPSDWLTLLDGMRARAEAKPAEAVTAPLAAAASAVAAVAAPVAEPVVEPVTALAAPGTGEPVAATAATPAAKPASAPAKDTEQQDRVLPDGAALPPPFALLSTAAPALQPAAPVLDPAAAAPAPATAVLESATDALGTRARQPLESPDPGQLDAMAARALADAAPGLASRTTAQTGGAKAADSEPGLDGLAQGLPAATSLAAGSERLPEPAPVQRHVATPMGQRGWDQAVSQQVSWLVRDQLQSASLSLNPPHLGPIQVTLQLDQQQATVQFVSAVPEVRQALQDALPTLRAMLGEAGIALGQADVGSRQSERERTAFQRSDRRGDAAEDEPVEVLVQPRAQGGGLLNLFA